MLEAATVFCGKAAPELVLEELDRCGADVRSDGPPGSWERAEAVFGDGSLVVTRKMFAPGSEFSRVVLGAHNYFRQVETDNQAGKARVLTLLEACDMMLGVRAEPPLDPDGPRYACTLALVTALDGLLFNGSDMLDGDSRVVLGADGLSEV